MYDSQFLPTNNKSHFFHSDYIFFQYLIWKTMSRFQNKPMADFPLVIENMFFTQESYIPDDGKIIY